MKIENRRADNKSFAGKMPLDTITPGSTVRIVEIDSGHTLKNRLAAMGLLKETSITVIRNDGAGQIIISVKNSRIILGRGMSHKIFVTHTRTPISLLDSIYWRNIVIC